MNLMKLLLIVFVCRIGDANGMDKDSALKVVETERLYARHFTVEDAP